MRNIAIPLVLLPILFFFNAAIFQKEDLRANGDLILIELAPVDPRSLMQGDYMRLRFKLVEDANKALQTLSQQDKEIRQENPREKVTALVVRIDNNQHASFAKLHRGESLADGEKLLSVQHRLRAKPETIKLTPTSYFFQEGHASLYQKARYGLMRVAKDGAHLLVGLADADGNRINP